MLSSKILKICKIESQAFAKYCVNRGIDYLGIHIIKYTLNNDKRKLIKYIHKIWRNNNFVN